MTRRSITVIALVLAAAAGCSGKTTDDPAPAGSGGAAGHSGNVGGAAGGTVTPPPSQGAASISFATADAPIVAMCSVPHRVTAPILMAGGTTTTDTNKGTEAIDGQNGSLVTCAVTPTAGGYNVSAQIHSDNGTNNFADIAISDLTIAEGQVDALGSLSVLDNITQNAYSSPTSIPCTFSVAGGALGIGPGKIWASVTCPSLIDPGNASGDTCKATGYIIFENCAQ